MVNLQTKRGIMWDRGEDRSFVLEIEKIFKLSFIENPTHTPKKQATKIQRLSISLISITYSQIKLQINYIIRLVVPYIHMHPKVTNKKNEMKQTVVEIA